MRLGVVVVCLLCVWTVSGCGSYRHYGLEQGTADTVHDQQDSFYVKERFEFKSLLFVSEDGNLQVSLQHPLHPIPEPQRFFSQLEFSLTDPVEGTLSIESVQLTLQSPDGQRIAPVRRFTTGDIFYVQEYSAAELPERLQEHVDALLTYQGESHRIRFSATVEKVHRWSRVASLFYR